MAPIDPNYYDTNVFSVSLMSSYATTVTSLIGLILYSLYNTYNDLPIALRTRHLKLERRNDLLVMAILAFVCAAANSYGIIEALVESYSNWALLKVDAVPTNIWTSTAWLPSNKEVGGLRLDTWLKEVDWIAELSFALAGRSRDYWYAQQLSMATMVWSVFVAVEGRRRNIQHTWAYLLLAHLLGLSTAQALFSIALILTPVTSRAVARSGRKMWSPHWSLLLFPVLGAFGCTAAFPYFDDNFVHAVLGAIPPILSVVPLIIMNTEFVPTSFGKTHSSLSSFHASFAPVFQASATLSLLLHLSTSGLALFLNTPKAQDTATTKYNLVWNTHERVPPSLAARVSVGLSKVLGSIADNPVVRKVGWDVLLSAVTLTTWSALRSLDVHDMLASVGCPGFKVRESHESHPLTAAATKGINEIRESAKLGIKDVKESAKHVSFFSNEDGQPETPESPSKRLSRASSPSSPSKRSARSASPSKRGRGRPRKSEGTIADVDFPEDEPRDGDYRPPLSQRDEQEHELEKVPSSGEAEAAEAAESAALTWGMLALGGLGLGSAGVWGAEVVGR